MSDAACDMFPRGSHKWNVCNGISDLPNYKVNRYREHWGLPPLSSKVGRKPEVVTQQFPVKVEFHGHSVSDVIPGLSKYGPGTELIKLFSKFKAPDCDECKSLAGQMNIWGVKRCREELDAIVEDILPRAKDWLVTRLPAATQLLPAKLLDSSLRALLRTYVEKSITAASKAKKTRTQATLPLSMQQRKPSGKGCSSCGRRRQPPKRPKLSPLTREGRVNGKVTNLHLDTTFGTAPSSLTSAPPPRSPYGDAVVRNLTYHIYPVGGLWKWNLDQLLNHIDLFNGRRIVGIVIDEKSASADEVRKYLGSSVHEYLVYQNNETQGEMVTFLPMLDRLKTFNPNEITFRAHAKGVIQQTKKAKHIPGWTEMLYTANLADPDLVDRQLVGSIFTGACRKFGQFHKKRGRPTYSGSFYWFRNCYVYDREWMNVRNRRWGCEEWPANIASREETSVTVCDNTGSMYSGSYWTDTVVPLYEKWKSERSELC